MAMVVGADLMRFFDPGVAGPAQVDRRRCGLAAGPDRAVEIAAL